MRKFKDRESLSTKIALANEEYKDEKAQAEQEGHPTRVTMAIIEKRFGLRPYALLNYRRLASRK